MGIVEKELTNFELESGEEVIIEKNIGGEIHIHMGNFRIDLTLSEFEEFANVIEQGTVKLEEIKNVSD